MENTFHWEPTKPFCMSAETDKLNNSLNKAIPSIPGVEKTKKAAFGMYATLDDLYNAIKLPLKDNGLSLEQYSAGEGWLITRLSHISGQWIVSGMKFPDDAGSKQTKQHALGGNITYFKRYCIAAILRISNDEDTDGHYPKQDPTPISKDQYEKLLTVLAAKPNYAEIVASVKKIEHISDMKMLPRSSYDELLKSLE